MEPERPATSARSGRVLLHNGVAALVFGIACVVLPVFLTGSPAARTLGQALRLPAYVGMALGLLLLGLHALARRNLPHVPAAAECTAAREPPSGWHAALFDDIDARGFDALCERLFAQAGFTTRREAHAPAGGADFALYSRHAEGPVAIVRCRHGGGRDVGVAELRDLRDVIVAHRLTRGSYATAATFTPEAARFAKEHGVNALDRERLLALIAGRTPEQQRDLLAAAYGTAGVTAPGTRTSP